MKLLKSLLVATLAFAAIFAASSTASADRIEYGRGGTSAPGAVIDFPNVGSISLTVGGTVSNCPLRLIADLGQKTTLRNGEISIGNVTGANPNPILGGQPCSANTVRLINFPWLVRVINPLPADGSINVSVRGVTAEIVGTVCVFTGDVTANINGANVTSPSGTLSSPLCGNATVGGTGGTITPSARLIV